MLEAANRAAALTHQLLAFSRKQVLRPRVLELNRVVSDMRSMLGRLIGEDIALVTRLDPDLGNLLADVGQIEQVIMNLAVNARDAMQDGGTLTIETSNADLEADYAARHPPVKAGRYVRLAVSDTGTGMDAEVQARLFEPFFTTKGPGKGTGLGLSTAYGIVRQSKGYIWVYSEVGVGTTFRIYLPRVDAEPEPKRDDTPVPLARGGETVLLVEDEKALRELLRETLEVNGYTVLVAGKAEEALRAAAEHDGPIHLLLTDVVLPGPSGRKLADELSGTRPETRVLYISGYTDEAISRHGIFGPGVPFLSKPFSSEALLRTIAELLGHGGSTQAPGE
jgi:CheY-like chemotaxis protein